MKALRGGKGKGIMEKMAKEMQGTTMPVHLIIHQVLGSGFNMKDQGSLLIPKMEFFVKLIFEV